MLLVRARRLVGVLATVASLWALLVPTPQVQPAPEGRPQASVVHLSAPRGYVESEHLLAGRASAYEAVGTWGADGRWEKRAVGERTPYRTRVLVNRPVDPRRFNGTVYVEWLNVSSGSDIAPSFAQARDQILSSGAVWVGVSAQRAGVESAKRVDPARYGSLDVASDALSYDIYSQAGKAVRARSRQLLGGLRPRRVIATGESQSAFRLTTYVNAFSRTTGVFDGFLVHSRFAPAAPLGEGMMGQVSPRIREDVDVPVLQLQTESDLGGWEAVRQPDRGNVHTWEVAGAAHADVYTLEAASGTDLDPESAAERMGCSRPVNDFPFHHAANAAYAALERWVRTGIRPRSAPPLEIVDDWLQRDADGVVRGGLRLPDVAVPLAVHSGQGNSALDGGFFCLLFGTTVPLPAERLAALYPTPEAYVTAYTAAADAALRAGFMTPFDRDAAVAAAREAARTLLARQPAG